MDARGRLACYPRSTFYLLSDGPSIRDHRITKPYFRTCSTYRSHSQAPFYLCAQRLIADQAEGTFGLLRYFLGGDRPSQTARLALSAARVTGPALELKQAQGGISHCGSSGTGVPPSQPPTYSTQDEPQPNTSLQ